MDEGVCIDRTKSFPTIGKVIRNYATVLGSAAKIIGRRCVQVQRTCTEWTGTFRFVGWS